MQLYIIVKFNNEEKLNNHNCERVWEKGPYGAKIEIEIQAPKFAVATATADRAAKDSNKTGRETL